MNILDIISRNQFLRQLFPNGIDDFFIGQLSLSIDNRVNFVLHSKNKPNIEIPKWGQWGKDYNIIAIEIIGQFIKKVNVNNWQNNHCEPSSCEISQGNDSYTIIFKGNNWNVEIELQSLTFQRSSTYIL
jgi:hypothetical protein